MQVGATLVPLSLAVALVLAACGDETGTGVPRSGAGDTLYVRAAGMVQSLGIT